MLFWPEISALGVFFNFDNERIRPPKYPSAPPPCPPGGTVGLVRVYRVFRLSKSLTFHVVFSTALTVTITPTMSSGLYFDMLSMHICTTRHWQMSGRLVQEFKLNGCTVTKSFISHVVFQHGTHSHHHTHHEFRFIF